MRVQQYKLRQNNERMIIWLDRLGLTPGTRLTVKKLDGIWEVEEAWGDIDKSQIKRGWNNNY